ncbi:bi-domain-containing oxidoreductase [Puia dinghuensis]|uniref:Oxidoreductase n=1 Tax=Puia dinghuensis TaxID=1792502 RepID=A0A8J2UET4_9BACT|nr:bi-domain-containing oxidoreductase [Puia dinghuensis]GGB06379.1 oxidoreductase [Puia dinghuensis]
MKQVIQNFKTGELYVDEVPLPALSGGMVLVENRFSLISAGTERSTVKTAKANLLGKARQRPDLVAQVLQNIRKEGLKATLEKVRTKLDSLKALGYSTAGVVVGSMDTEGRFKPGDRVACAGQDYASHAEMVSIPQNLVARIPDNVSFEEASFTTLGAIALQGVRQAEPQLGESVCVIGLGLLGQITCQLLKANGCRVLGIDMSARLAGLARQLGADEALTRDDADLKNVIEHFTNGYGFDSIIITAAAPSNDPIELSAEIARKKGRVVVVGAVKMDIPRDPHFYRKELELRMSCSYGPGRYDVHYEEQGVDYPYGYVRWTEQRNMEAFLQLLSQKKLDLNALITHRFDIDEAATAYDIVMGKVQEPHIGILLHYPPNDRKFHTFTPMKSQAAGAALQVGFIGAGSFAQNYLIPPAKQAGATLQTVVTSKGITAKNVATKFAFAKASTDSSDIIDDPGIDTVFIATQHDTHASYALECLKAGKKVFVEKPLAMTEEGLEDIRSFYEAHGGFLMVGFNRRFSPVAQALKKEFEGVADPLVINYRVNAGFIPKEHWTQQADTGGGRIIGEVCHFIDLLQFFTGSLPVRVFAECIGSDNSRVKNDDNVLITIRFQNGSIGTITYAAEGDKALAKERVELFGGGKAGIINDFRSGEIFHNNKAKTLKLDGKGHRQEVEAFLNAAKTGGNSPIPFESIYYTTLTSFKILDSLSSGLPQAL